jgi:hypothetical protein
MAADFDIDDRNSWAWKDGVADQGVARIDERYALHLDDRDSWYEFKDGVPNLHKCPIDDGETGSRLIFDPRVMACNWPGDSAEEDIYDWAVSSGLVEDQR